MGDSVPKHTGPISLTDTHLEPSVLRTRPTQSAALWGDRRAHARPCRLQRPLTRAKRVYGREKAHLCENCNDELFSVFAVWPIKPVDHFTSTSMRIQGWIQHWKWCVPFDKRVTRSELP
jgi:hypothetical protein